MTGLRNVFRLIRSATLGGSVHELTLLVLAACTTWPYGATAQTQRTQATTSPAVQAPLRPVARQNALKIEDVFDENALDNCLKQFQAYKADTKGGKLLIRFTAGHYRCRIQHPRRIAINQANALAKLPLALKIMPARPTELSYWFYQGEERIDGQVVVPKTSEYLQKATINPSLQNVLTFVFDTAGMPDFKNAVVQINGREASQPFPGSNQSPASSPEPCKDWDHPAAPIAQFTVPVVPAKDKALSATHRQVTINLGQTLLGIPNHTSQYLSIRLVPLSNAKGAGPTCLNGPATNTVELTAAMEDVAQNIKESEQKKAAEDAYRISVTGQDGTKASPIKVEVMTFLPEYLGTTYSYLDELVTIISFHADNFPDGQQDFPVGCAFNVQEYLSVGPPRHWYDPIVEVIDGYAQLYAMMEHAVANLVVAVITVGQCAPSDPIDGSGGTHSSFCNAANTVTFVAVQYAATLIGLPPSLPTVSGLTDEALTWAATQAVDYGLSFVPAGSAVGTAAGAGTDSIAEAAAEGALATAADQSRDFLIEKTKEGMRNALKLNTCYFQQPSKVDPALSNIDAYHWQKEEQSGCYTSFSEIYSYGTKNMAYYPRDAIMYLRVKKNPGGVQITKNVNLELDLGDYYNAHAGSPFAPDHHKVIPIHVDELPEKGALIPVTLYRSYAKFIDAAKVGCINCLDVDQAEAAWLHQAYEAGVPSTIQVYSQYAWTNSALNPNGTTGVGITDAHWLSHPFAINKEETFGNYSFRDSVLPKSAPHCPGFMQTKYGTYAIH